MLMVADCFARIGKRGNKKNWIEMMRTLKTNWTFKVLQLSIKWNVGCLNDNRKGLTATCKIINPTIVKVKKKYKNFSLQFLLEPLTFKLYNQFWWFLYSSCLKILSRVGSVTFTWIYLNNSIAAIITLSCALYYMHNNCLKITT